MLGETAGVDCGAWLLGSWTGVTSLLICARSVADPTPSVFDCPGNVEELFSLSLTRVRLETRLAAGCVDGLVGGARLLVEQEEFVSRTLRRLDASRLMSGRFSRC